MSSQNEKPIIFNSPMVRAILNGNKSQTRRVIKPQPCPDVSFHLGVGVTGFWCGYPNNMDAPTWEARCPYGKPGDQLWVRETFAEMCKLADPYCWCEYPSGEFNPDHYIEYRADSGNKYPGDWDDADMEEQKADYVPRWRPSIHMFRWQSRIQLEITGVRVERVQDISEEDCEAEGINSYVYESSGGGSNPRRAYVAFPDKEGGFPTARQAFEALWDSINEKRGFGWDVNPWVWVVEFKVIEVKNGNKN